MSDFAAIGDVIGAWQSRDTRCYRAVAALSALGSRRGGDDDLAALAVVALLDAGVARVSISLRDVCEVDDVRTAVWEEVKHAEPQLDAMAARYLLARARQRLSRPAGGMVSRIESVSLEQCLEQRAASGGSGSSGGAGRDARVGDDDPLLAVPEQEDAAADLAGLLRWAAASGVLTRAQVELLQELVAAENLGVPREDAQALIGRREGVAMRTIRRRRDAALARLRESAAHYLAATA